MYFFATSKAPACDFEGAGLHDPGFDDVLNLLDRQCPVERLADAGNILADRLYLLCRQCVLEFYSLVGLRHGSQNFIDGELLLRPASLYDLHLFITISCVDAINDCHILCFLRYTIPAKMQPKKIFFCYESGAEVKQADCEKKLRNDSRSGVPHPLCCCN